MKTLPILAAPQSQAAAIEIFEDIIKKIARDQARMSAEMDEMERQLDAEAAA